MIRLLMVDDHPRVREALARVLHDPEAGIEVVGVAPSGKEAIRLLEGQAVEVVLLDVSMPEMDGLAVTAHLRIHFPHVKVLLLTLLEPGARLETALAAGAKGFLLKTAGKKELLEAIRAVAAGQTYLGAGVANGFGKTGAADEHAPPNHSTAGPRPGDWAPDEPVAGAAEWPFPVSERERHLLRLLDRGRSPGQIEEELLMSRPTQERYLAQLRANTGTTGTDDLLAWLHRQGLSGI